MTSNPAPRAGQGWFVVLVLISVAVAAVGWRVGGQAAGYVLSASFVLFAVARGRVPGGRVGPLVVRSRVVDVTLMLCFAAVLLVVTVSLPAG